jgi:DNA-directed RNA polymerase sigma subunit (sigma70/sigma32)
MRYGLQDGVCQTLKEVGRRLDLTRERIRQIEKGAISKLSHHFNQEEMSPLSD